MLAALTRTRRTAISKGDPVIDTLKQLASDAAQMGATAVFLGHPDEQHYEFLAKGARYAGRLNPRFADQVRLFLREHGLIRLNSHLSSLQAGLTGNGEREIVCLSWAREPDARSAPEPNEQVAPELLIIDDDPRYTALIEQVLLRHGYRVETRTNCSAALDDLSHAELQPNLILCDLHTPEMSGATFVRRFRSSGKSTPIIVLTGETDEAVEARLILLGANAFVRKHDDPRVLLAWCSSLLGLRAREDS